MFEEKTKKREWRSYQYFFYLIIQGSREKAEVLAEGKEKKRREFPQSSSKTLATSWSTSREKKKDKQH